jgi:hypothetical protein
MTRAKVSTINAPPNASGRVAGIQMTRAAATASTRMAAISMNSPAWRRKTPIISSAMAATARNISGMSAAAPV